jgi:hypothetical protein
VGGTQENTAMTFVAAGAANTVSTAAFRLYPTLSESLFKTDRSATSLNTTDTTARQRMETGRFFLTTHSRAPELNLFGLPRVSIWPMAYNAALRTAVDNLIGFCTTIGGTQGATSTGEYFFTRSSSYDSTVDIGLKDSNGTYRNATLLNYLDYLTSQEIPGFGGDFKAKDYGSGLTGQNDQILTEIFDYIRATNIQDATSASPYGSFQWQGSWWGIGQVVPSLINKVNSGGILNWNTQGFASFPRLIEASIQFVAMGRVGTTATGTGDGSSTVLTTSAVVNPSVMSAYSGSGLSLIGVGDSSSSLTYPYNPSGPPTLDLPYAAPGAAGGAPATGPYNTIYPVLNTKTGLLSGIPPDGTNAVQAFLILTFINPAQDWIYCSPYVWASVSGLSSFAINGHPLNFPDPDCMVFGSGQDWHGGGRSGYTPIDINFQAKSLNRTAGQVNNNPTWGYPFFSSIIPITSDNTSASLMSFAGGAVTIQLYDAPTGPNWPPPTPMSTGAPTGGHLVQTYTINFPTSSVPVPLVPRNPTPTAKDAVSYYNLTPPVPPATTPPVCDNRDTEYPPNSILPLPYAGSPGGAVPNYKLPERGLGNGPFVPWVTPYVAYSNSPSPYTIWPQQTNQVNCFEQSGPIIGLGAPSGSTPAVPSPMPSAPYVRWNQNGQTLSIADYNYIGTGDVVESMVLSKAWSDPRLLSIANVPSTAFVQHQNWGNQFAENFYWGMVKPAIGNGTWTGSGYYAPYFTGGDVWPNTPCVGTLAGNQVEPQPGQWPTFAWAPSIFGNNQMPLTSSGLLSGKYPPFSTPPDWDSGLITGSDGPWVNKADEGCGVDNGLPYYSNPQNEPPTLFSANRQIPSPGMFGSLPTGVDPTGAKPAGWQSLLFRPGPGAAGYAGMTHPGEGVPATAGVYSPPYTTPPDHLWMDLFWIPVAEPYAISEPMSTAGKINLNYQIIPFTYIKRATALRAALATEKIAQVSLGQSTTCKGNDYGQGLALNGNYGNNLGQQVPSRYPIDLDTTMSQFDNKFNNWDIFRSASQICEEFLVPMDIPNKLANGIPAPSTTGPYQETITSAGNYTLPAFSGDTTGVLNFAKDWYVPVATTPPQDPTNYTNAPFAMVGDNLREQPYTHLYGKLTTKSNTFTVYYRVQSLKKPTAVAANQWNENLGSVTGEYRGSTTIERFIDPNEKTAGVNVVPDAAGQLIAGNTPTSLEGYYKWRVAENHQFAP